MSAFIKVAHSTAAETFTAISHICRHFQIFTLCASVCDKHLKSVGMTLMTLVTLVTLMTPIYISYALTLHTYSSND
jgi:hypothetical protein